MVYRKLTLRKNKGGGGGGGGGLAASGNRTRVSISPGGLVVLQVDDVCHDILCDVGAYFPDLPLLLSFQIFMQSDTGQGSKT